MKIKGIEFPESLITALRDKKLVVFAGAGVSMGHPAELPSFAELAAAIAEGTGFSLQNNEPEEHFLGRLQHAGVDIHKIANDILSKNKNIEPTNLHHYLLALYFDMKQIRIVTTNFDLLFEGAAESDSITISEVFCAPALPLGGDFTGIVHLHGSLSKHTGIILSDADFGRAYLTEGWALRFLLDMFRNYTVLFVGYQHNDTIINYLARALPINGTDARYALTEENDDLQRWNILGIKPILYSKPSTKDFSVLTEGVHGLSDILRRGYMEWQRVITELAAKLPPVNEEDISNIEFALKNDIYTGYFVSTARSPEWIDWLDSRGLLNALFKDGSLGDLDLKLADWLAEYYAINHSDYIFLLIAKHKMSLNNEFWYCLVLRFDTTKTPKEALDNVTLSRWIFILTESFPKTNSSIHLLLNNLGEQCAIHEMVKDLLKVFCPVARCQLSLSTYNFDFNLYDEFKASSLLSRIEVRVSPYADRYLLNIFWEKYIKPNLKQLSDSLLENIVSYLEEQNSMLYSWNRATRNYNSASNFRNAIEINEQDRDPTAIDVLIDCVRDSLKFLVSNRDQLEIERWCNKLSKSDSPLLRRLAVHGVFVRDDLTEDEKIQWLLGHIDIFDDAAHHEIFRLMQMLYPKASEEQRQKIIEIILNCTKYLDEDNHEKAETKNSYYRFMWLHWLNNSYPQCSLASKALNELLAKYSDFKPREHPDQKYSIPARYDGPSSPFTVKELLAKTPKEWLGEILSFKQTEFNGPDRDGFISVIEEASKQNKYWGLALAECLIEIKEYDSDLWTNLMYVWINVKFSEDEYKRLLIILGDMDLRNKHQLEVAMIFNSFFENDDDSYISKLLPDVNKIAADMWQYLDSIEDILSAAENGDLYGLAINSTSGALARYWMKSLNIYIKTEKAIQGSLNTEYCRVLSDVVNDTTENGVLGRTILAGSVDFLLSVDEKWTRKYIIPFFDLEDKLNFQAVWEGFLTENNITPEMFEYLETPFLKAVARLNSDLLSISDRFISQYVRIIVYFVENPLKKWIPILLNCSGDKIKISLAAEIKHFLRNVSKKQQKVWWERWLKKYWNNRIDGVPVGLVLGEIENMLEWLPLLEVSVFSEAVEKAIKMPSMKLNIGTLVDDLKEANLTEKCPESMAKLLIYIGGTDSPRNIWYGGDEIIKCLMKLTISPDIKEQLRELAAKLGFMCN